MVQRFALSSAFGHLIRHSSRTRRSFSSVRDSLRQHHPFEKVIIVQVAVADNDLGLESTLLPVTKAT